MGPAGPVTEYTPLNQRFSDSIGQTPPRVLPLGELSGDHPPLRRDQRPRRHPRLPQAALPPARLPLLARAGSRPAMTIRTLTAVEAALGPRRTRYVA